MKIIANTLEILFDGGYKYFTEQEVKNALEKQVPKKPVTLKRFVGKCPNCDSIVEFPMMKAFDIKKDIPHCKWCGQALDWSDQNAR